MTDEVVHMQVRSIRRFKSLQNDNEQRWMRGGCTEMGMNVAISHSHSHNPSDCFDAPPPVHETELKWTHQDSQIDYQE